MTHGGPIGIYDITKAGLIHMTKHLATELAPQVRVNAIAPGLVKTDFARALWEPNEQAAANIHPLNRIGIPDDIAGAAVFLSSDAASWMTGHVLLVHERALLKGFAGARARLAGVGPAWA